MSNDKKTRLEEDPNYMANLIAENKKNEDARKIKSKLLLGSGVAILGYSAYKMESKKEFVAALAVGGVGVLTALGSAWGGGNQATKIAIPFIVAGSASYIVTRGIFQKSINTSLIAAAILGGLFFAYEYNLEHKPSINLKQQLGQQQSQPIQSINK